MAGNGTDKPSDEGAKNGVPWWLLLVIALALVVVYVVAELALARRADDPGVTEVVWGRWLYLLGGGEAIVFVAVGWLFGREVNRKQAEQAEAATDEAKDASADAATEKARRQALAAAVRTTLGNRKSLVGLDPDLQALVDLADGH